MANAGIASGAFTFSVLKTAGDSTGSVALRRPVKKPGRSCTVPKTIAFNGCLYKVTAVAGKAFSRSTKLKSVTIGRNVTAIGSKAFYKCGRLKTVKFAGKSITKISSGAFQTCARGCTFKIPKSKYKKVVKLLKKSGVPKGAKFKRI